MGVSVGGLWLGGLGGPPHRMCAASQRLHSATRSSAVFLVGLGGGVGVVPVYSLSVRREWRGAVVQNELSKHVMSQ